MLCKQEFNPSVEDYLDVSGSMPLKWTVHSIRSWNKIYDWYGAMPTIFLNCISHCKYSMLDTQYYYWMYIRECITETTLAFYCWLLVKTPSLQIWSFGVFQTDQKDKSSFKDGEHLISQDYDIVLKRIAVIMWPQAFFTNTKNEYN